VVGTQAAVEVRVRGMEVSIGGATPLTVNGHPYATAWDGETLWLGAEGRTWTVHEEVRTHGGASGSPGGGGVLRSPMPGTVLAVKVAQGDQVTAGQPVVIVEAMKMEHTVTAPLDGVVTRLPARAGAQVKLDEVLAEISGGA
jgi:acetyl-CoA/propionyl-CoA carboxylase biotin carboxyl carrier protein